MGAPDRRGWFELSDEGWGLRAGSRPLGRLLLEAVQNSLDERAENITLDLGAGEATVEDDAPHGFEDERLVYTVFLSSKSARPDRRGRLGRGLKELIASMERAEVHTVGRTVIFGQGGRQACPNDREEGTRIVLCRRFAREEVAQAEACLCYVIPPLGVQLRVNGCTVKRPTLVLSLSDCEMPTVCVDRGRALPGSCPTSLSIYAPRRGEVAHVYEMGIPVQPWDVPWHVDVGQRLPLWEGREQLPEEVLLRLKGTLLEAMIHRYMEPRDLRADWVRETLARWPVQNNVLDAYVSRVLPRGAVLESGPSDNDRASQLGAHVIDAATLTPGMSQALGQVLETSVAFVRRREAELGAESVSPDAAMAAFAQAVRHVAYELTGMRVSVGFFSSPPGEAGLIEDAVTDVDRRCLRFNIQAGLRFDDLLDPRTFGVILHELAHIEHPLHDQRFIDRLQLLSGHAARWLALRQPGWVAALKRGDVDDVGP